MMEGFVVVVAMSVSFVVSVVSAADLCEIVPQQSSTFYRVVILSVRLSVTVVFCV